MVEATAAPGTTPGTIAGRYRVERAIGRGGMGTVWLCRDERLQREVAVKQIGILPDETVPDLARAMREARSSAGLNHPHVVSIYDVVEEGDHIWLVMEYVVSRTLAQIIADDGPQPPETVAAIGAQVSEALAATHTAGTIHRDVKPGNILVTPGGVAKISDFGIARALDQSQLTSSGLVIGTPTYFSPELARGEEPTRAADVWALGATLFAAVEGHSPYPDQANALALLGTIASTPPPRPERAGFLTEPIVRMLDPDPGSRWSMADAAHVLKRLHQQHPAPAPGEATTELTRSRAAAPLAAPPVAAAVGADSADPRSEELEPDRPSRGRAPGGLMIAALAVLLAAAGVVGYLLLQGTQTGDPAAQGSGRAARSGHHTAHGGRSPSGHPTKQPQGQPTGTARSASAPTSATTTTSSPAVPPEVGGGSAKAFVDRYYSALPSDTRSAWAALSPAFQNRIGGYDRYVGFWSTISRVSVTDAQPAGRGAVDASLTYTRNDGSTSSEVRRIYLERQGSGYLITGDAVVG